MFKRDPNKAEQNWKTKYFNSLEELEKKEKVWEGFDNVMRTAMSRLSILLDGQDKELDKELDYLRRTLRRGGDANKINAQLKAVLEVLEKVEIRKKLNRPLSASEAYQQLLDGVRFPKGTARKLKSLYKTVDKLQEGAKPDAVISEFAELLQDSFGLVRHAAEEKARKQQSSPAPEEEETESRNAADLNLVEDTDLSAKSVLQTLLEKLLLPEESQQAARIVGERVQAAELEQELNQLAVDLAHVLNSAFPPGMADTDISDIADMAEAEPGLTINEVLLQLLERIELPSELGEDVESIQHALEGHVGDEAWPGLLERISRLIRQMREKANEEKKNLEAFLTQLTDQLQTLDNFISGVEQDHIDSISYGLQLQERMQGNIDDMGQSVDQASGLEQLKDVIRDRLETIAEHMEEFRVHEETRDERTQDQIKRLNEKIKLMEADSELLRKQVHKERESAMTDPLTQVANRMAFDERLEQEYARWKRYQAPLSLIVIDIDFFKKINDNFGHMAGDKVLHTVAQHLKKIIRETDFIARYGGEEFVVIMPDTAAKEGLGVADKLRAEVESCGFHFRGDAVKVTISCGVAEFSGNDAIDDVFDRADQAMYEAKQAGRNRCVSA